ncbi:MAG: aldo/keto reductase [Candidatus Hydrogenedentota bacterium]
MEYRKLGKSGIEVSALAFGAWQLGDTAYWGEDDQADADLAVGAAIDGGITLFDTAEMYGEGRSEEVLGKVLGNKRGQVLIASKVLPGHCAPDKLRTACEASLKRLSTDCIDLYQVHWPNREVPFEATYAELARLRAEGKIRAIGVSNYGAHDLTEWMRVGTAESNQLGYNLLFRAIEYEILPACREFGVGVLVYMPILQGILAGKWENVGDIPVKRRRTRHFSGEREGARHGEPGHEALLIKTLGRIRAIAEDAGRSMAELALAWCMARPGVTSVIVGARKPAQLARNLDAAHHPLEKQILQLLDEATRPLRDAMGENPDMWLGAGECRIR